MAPGVGADMVEARERASATDKQEEQGQLRQRKGGKMVNGDGHSSDDDSQLDFDVEIPGNEAMRQRE